MSATAALKARVWEQLQLDADALANGAAVMSTGESPAPSLLVTRASRVFLLLAATVDQHECNPVRIITLRVGEPATSSEPICVGCPVALLAEAMKIEQ